MPGDRRGRAREGPTDRQTAPNDASLDGEADVGAPSRIDEHDRADHERREAERQRDGEEDEEQTEEGRGPA